MNDELSLDVDLVGVEHVLVVSECAVRLVGRTDVIMESTFDLEFSEWQSGTKSCL